MLLPPSLSSEGDPLWFAARMTSVQFAALAARLQIDGLARDTEAAIRSQRMTAATSCDRATVARWLLNGWSTEILLCLNQSAFNETDALRHSLHWAFPQAYYSAFSLALGYFKAVGFPETSHKAVLRKFAQEVIDGRYPDAISFALTGAGSLVFKGLRATSLPTTITFDASDPAIVDGQITQYLRATRGNDLKAKKQELKFKTKTGGKKKALRKAEWEEVASKLGPTALLHLLYRKRIKANYKDIETFLHPEMNPHRMYANLLTVLDGINFVHEAFIATAMGPDFINEAVYRLPEHARSRVQARRARISRESA